jgi:ABC transport system ATP-binding/permease protein
MICVDAERIGVVLPDKVLFADLSLTIATGDRVAVTGVNGSGKSTLLRVLTGIASPDDGVVRFARGLRVAALEQDPQLPEGTVAGYLGDSWEVAAVATSLGLQPLLDLACGELSGGQAKRVALAKALVGEPDLIVLDEPTNHLDLEAIEWLEARLLATTAAVVIVTHDRHLLERVTAVPRAGKVVELSGGRGFVHTATSGTSAYAAYLDESAARTQREAGLEATRRNLARRELAWLRRGAPARSTKPKARLRRANEIVDGGAAVRDPRGHELQLGAGFTRLGNQVVELVNVTQRFGEHDVVRDVDLVIEPGARLGVVGPNGSGKSTLLDIVAGRRAPTNGEVRRGATVVTGYADQRSSSLDPDAVVRELVAGPHRQPDWEDRVLLERFWFDTNAQYAPTRMLSGGERRRLLVVMVLAAKPNLLVLDEPTNDLDLDTLRALESFLEDWPGALIVASHDRAFLDRTVDHVLAVDTETAALRRVQGGVAGWLRERRRESAPRRTVAPPPAADRTRTPTAYTLGRRLRQTEQAIAKAEQVRDRLVDALSGTTEHGDLARIGEELATAQADLAGLEEQWLTLAEQQSD